MRFGDYLLSKKLVTPEQLSKALESQRSYTRPLGKLARELGYISRRNNVQVLLDSIKSGQRYGDIAVKQGFLTRQQVEDLLEIQKRDSVTIGNLLVEDEVLTKHQLLESLRDFIPFMSKVEK
jgi:hypothetical protein